MEKPLNPLPRIEGLILFIRGQKIILDADLAALHSPVPLWWWGGMMGFLGVTGFPPWEATCVRVGFSGDCPSSSL